MPSIFMCLFYHNLTFLTIMVAYLPDLSSKALLHKLSRISSPSPRPHSGSKQSVNHHYHIINHRLCSHKSSEYRLRRISAPGSTTSSSILLIQRWKRASMSESTLQLPDFDKEENDDRPQTTIGTRPGIERVIELSFSTNEIWSIAQSLLQEVP